jgi:hypothetical protein
MRRPSRRSASCCPTSRAPRRTSRRRAGAAARAGTHADGTPGWGARWPAGAGCSALHPGPQQTAPPPRPESPQVWQQLEAARHVPDFNNYLSFVFSKGETLPSEVRNAAGLLLKNNLKQQYATTTEDFRSYIKAGLGALGPAAWGLGPGAWAPRTTTRSRHACFNRLGLTHPSRPPGRPATRAVPPGPLPPAHRGLHRLHRCLCRRAGRVAGAGHVAGPQPRQRRGGHAGRRPGRALQNHRGQHRTGGGGLEGWRGGLGNG